MNDLDDIKPPTTGRIYMSGDHGTVHVAPGDPAPEWAVVAPERPSTSDSKADWVAFGVSVGIKDAATLTKAELIDSTKEQGN